MPVEEDFYLWPENQPVWDLWLWLQTQWLTDQGVRTGMNYPGVQVVINNWPLRKKDRAEHFRLVQAMEFASLDEWSKQR